jgi:tRNA threonylcarbamoyladenosine biosynthesis protein TsaB
VLRKTQNKVEFSVLQPIILNNVLLTPDNINFHGLLFPMIREYLSYLLYNFVISFNSEGMGKKILSIETAVNVCSVCVSEDGTLLAVREDFGVNNHAAKLGVFIEEVMLESRTEYSSLDAVAVSGGPGSYTGLRIGVSSAKGICYAADIPLIAVDTLQAMAFIMRDNVTEFSIHNVLFQPMIDARRMEVFTALYDKDLNRMTEITSDIIDETYFRSYDSDTIHVLGGNGSGKLKIMFAEHQQLFFIEQNVHTATGVAAIALDKFLKSDFADVAYYEPFYLKDFIPGKPKVKGLQ